MMMDDVIGASVAPRRTNTLLISAFATLALLLASLGVYGVISYGVAQRSRELGIRAALGATASDLMSLVSREMLWVVGVGLSSMRERASELYQTAQDKAGEIGEKAKSAAARTANPFSAAVEAGKDAYVAEKRRNEAKSITEGRPSYPVENKENN